MTVPVHPSRRAPRAWLACLAAVLSTCALGASSAAAAPITVTSLGNAGPGTLRAALETAPSGSTIVVPAGTINLSPPALPVTQSVTVAGAGAGATVINGGGATRVITITGTPTVTLEGLTITGGASQFGAGINSTGGTLTLKGVEMTGNHATLPKGAGFGGAIFTGAGALNIIESTLSHNVAGGEGNAGFGGAILYNEEAGPASFALSIVRSTLAGNRAGGGGGKGAGFGGAILEDTSSKGATLSLSILDSTLSGNAAGGGGGEADAFGGAIEFDSAWEGVTESFVVERSSVTGNSAGGGGGAEAPGLGGGIEYDVDNAASGTGRIVNTTVAQNTAGGGGAAGFGGGLDGEGPLSLSFDTIAGNAAGGGGGQAFGGGVELDEATPVTATLLALNAGGDCFFELGAMPFKSEGHNIVDDQTCQLAPPLDKASGDKQGVAVGLGPLAGNGGPTQTLLPLPGSPAIDSGPASGCPATDQRGVTRPQGAACDVGAVEVAPPAVSTGPPRGVVSTSATVSGTASNAGAQAGSTYFQYGTTTAYGAQTGPQLLPAFIGPGTFTALLSGLAPHTIYHYRAVASTPEGTVVGADATFTTQLPAPPSVSHLAQSHASWRVGRALAHLSRRSHRRRAPTGTAFSFELSEAATVKLQFLTTAPGRVVAHKCVAQKRSNRHRRSCTRTITAGTLTLAGHAGRNKVSFSGRLSSSRALAPGTYTLVLTAVDGFAQSSAPQRLKFKIVR